MSEEPKTPAWCETLYEAKAAALILYGRALGLSHAEAEDVLQETFLALMRLEKTPEDPHCYCLRAFRNRALNFRRSLWRRLVREFESKRWFDSEPAFTDQEMAAVQCLANLSLEQREVIILKIWHRKTFEQIGGLLGISPNTAAGRYRYGLQKLRACLTKEAHERDETNREPLAFMESAEAIGEGWPTLVR